MPQPSYTYKPASNRLRRIQDWFDDRATLTIFLILALSLIGVVTSWYFLSETESFIPLGVAIFASGVTLSVNYRAHRTEKDKLFKELFVSFNERYELHFNNQLDEILGASTKESTLNPQQKATIVAYLNLCAEEYLWYKRHRIPQRVWDSWEAGMMYFLRKEPFISIFRQEEENDQFQSYYGLFNHLKDKRLLRDVL